MKITSDTLLLDVDRHVRVVAGPGAGKTYWLVTHIKNVLRRSKRFHRNATLGVISYTNVAADHLRSQLGPYAARVDVTTIHSFLYRHIVRPYVYLIRDESGNQLVNPQLLDGHDEHRVNYNHFSSWLKSHQLQMLLVSTQKKYFSMLQDHMATIHWRQCEDLADWHLALHQEYGLSQKTRAQLTPQALFEYKQQYWKEGRIDHDDVLYFALRILNQYPAIRECISAKFPFICVDEFQDTVPAQTKVVRLLAKTGSIVVVIGDAEQAIFEFAGAAPDNFRDFDVPDMDEYEITYNRRSTEKIVSLLNQVRKDGLVQEAFRSGIGSSIRLLVGSPLAAANYARTAEPEGRLLVLSRNQDIVDELLANTEKGTDNPWNSIEDAPARRGLFLRSVCAAIVLARKGRFDLSLKELEQGIRHDKGKLREPFKGGNTFSSLHRRAIGVTVLESLLSLGSKLETMSIRSAYDHVSLSLARQFSGLSLVKITAGDFAKKSEQLTVGQILSGVHLENTNEVRDIRTIHKAKGTEAERVLVCLHSTRNEDRIQHLLNPASPSSEEQRLTYVALSRARDVLVLAVASLSPEQEQQLELFDISTVKL